jgi:hypothetical protein
LAQPKLLITKSSVSERHEPDVQHNDNLKNETLTNQSLTKPKYEKSIESEQF